MSSSDITNINDNILQNRNTDKNNDENEYEFDEDKVVIKMNGKNNSNNSSKNNVSEDNKSVKSKSKLRKRIFEIVEVAESGDYLSLFYDILMISSIIVSLIPLAYKEEEEYKIFKATDYATACIFIIDYLLRYLTADFKLKEETYKSFIKYPFTLWAIIDLVSILPSITILYSQLKILRILIMIRTLKIVRVFKAFRYSRSILIISKVIKTSKHPLMAVGTLAVGYILTSALIIFNVEPYSFESFFDAVYWATVSLTTVGYGDLYPTSTEGRVIAMISSLFGIALVALPSGIITAGYMDSLSEMDRKRKLSKSANLTSDISSSPTYIDEEQSSETEHNKDI